MRVGRSPGLTLAFALAGAGACTGRNPAFQPPAADATHDAARPQDTGNPPVSPAPADAAPAPPDVIPPAGEDSAVAMDAGPPPPGPVADAGTPAPPEAGPPDATDAPPAEPDLPHDVAPDLVVARALCPADPDLVLCVPFENNEVKDDSTRHLAIQASGVTFPAGATATDGTAGSFTTSSRVQIPYNAAMDVTAVTIEATVTPARLPADNARMGILDYTHEYSLFLYPKGRLRCIVVLGSGVEEAESSDGLVAATGTTHVACTVSDKSIVLWRNGVPLNSKTITSRLETGSGAKTMVIGGNFSSSDPDPFEGQIDNLRVWRTARTGSNCAGGLSCPP